MISQLHIKNFKCFGDQQISVEPLTLLAGANATGKSTTIQALLLLRQGYLRGDFLQGRLRLNGDLVNVGEAKDAKYDQAGDDVISFELRERNSETPERFSFLYERGKPEAHSLDASSLGGTTSSLFSKQFTYISAERLGPRLSYPIADETRQTTSVGVRGEFTAYCLDEFGTEAISIPQLALESESRSVQLLHQTQLWMRYIAPDLQMTLDRMGSADVVRIAYKNHGVSGDYLRPTNMGFGVSYALPIIVATLLTDPGNIVIVENPEAHLHPAAQSRIAEFLCRAATLGVQVILETHSDHVLNGLRICVKRNLITPKDVSIQFFSRDEEQSLHRVSKLLLDSDGRLDSWPEGFFDQTENDLLELI